MDTDRYGKKGGIIEIACQAGSVANVGQKKERV